MYKTLLDVYDWYHDDIRPTCAPQEYDDNILAPSFYGKQSLDKKDVIEVSVLPNGRIGFVRPFSFADDASIGEKYALTPSCIQHRRNGAHEKQDSEFQFINKFSVIFGRNTGCVWYKMMSAWVEYHKSHRPDDKSIDIIEQIVKIVSRTPESTFRAFHDRNGLVNDKSIIVFTKNGEKVFDNNPSLWESYREFYLQWIPQLYKTDKKLSLLTGREVVNVTMKNGDPVLFGTSYTNARKLFIQPSVSSSLDTHCVFNSIKEFSNVAIGVEEQWKILNTFDYLSEQQRERSIKMRNILFFAPTHLSKCKYTASLRYTDALFAAKKYRSGFKWEQPKELAGLDVGYICWTSPSKGRSSIDDYISLPIDDYYAAFQRFNSFFDMRFFCVNQLVNIASTDSGEQNRMRQKLLHAILSGAPLPKNIESRFTRKALNPVKASAKSQVERHYGYKGDKAKYYYWNLLSCAAGMLYYEEARNNEWKEPEMSLNRGNSDRSYLFGRLTAIYQQIESLAMMAGGQERSTNAEKLMTSIAQRPFTSMLNLEKKVSPYKQRLQHNRRGAYVYLEQLLFECFDLIDDSDFKSDEPLDSSFLLGYYCQRADFYKRKTEEESESAGSGNNLDDAAPAQPAQDSGVEGADDADVAAMTEAADIPVEDPFASIMDEE